MGSSGISAELYLCVNGNSEIKSARGASSASSCIVGLTVLGACCIGFVSSGQADVYINDRYPISNPARGGNSLSPPHIAATNECSTHVYVNSFIPKATIRVYLNGTTTIIGSATPQTGFAAIPLSQQLQVGDKVTATQTVNGVVSAPSAAAVIDDMPKILPKPTVDPNIHACGRIVPVRGLLSGVTVQVTDETAHAPLGSGSTPNLWGSDWGPIGTTPLAAGHQVTATQTACKGKPSDASAPATVMGDPMPMVSPKLVPPVVGNDTLTVDSVYTGADLAAVNIAVNPPASLGGGFATSPNVWMELAQPLTATEDITVAEKLCSNDTAKSTPEKPVATLTPPVLLGPICPDQTDVKVSGTTLNATLVLLKNGSIVGYGGAAPGDAVLDVAPPNAFAVGDKVSVVEYIGTIVAHSSNIVTVNCAAQNVVTQHNDNARQGAQLHETKLTPSTVSGPNFGLLYDRHVLGTLLAQPLYVHGVNIKNEIRNVIFAATAADIVYAFDADDVSADTTTSVNGYDNNGNLVPLPESTKWLWRASLGTPHVGDICGETVPPIVGITSAPVIDVSAGVMYVVARDQHDEHGMGHDYLHALDIETGHDLRNRQVKATDPVHGFVFNDACQRQRPALLLQNGVVYLGYGTYTCDAACSSTEPYRGWILGFRATDFAPAGAFTNSQSYGEGGMGVWASGNGLAGSDDGSIFYQTGNDINSSLAVLGDSFVKLHGDGKTLSMTSHYQPPAADDYRAGDTDLGAGGPMLLPNGKLIGGGKDGMFFTLSQSDLSSKPASFQAFFNTFHLPTPGTAGLDPSEFSHSQSLLQFTHDLFRQMSARERLWRRRRRAALLHRRRRLQERQVVRTQHPFGSGVLARFRQARLCLQDGREGLSQSVRLRHRRGNGQREARGGRHRAAGQRRHARRLQLHLSQWALARYRLDRRAAGQRHVWRSDAGASLRQRCDKSERTLEQRQGPRGARQVHGADDRRRPGDTAERGALSSLWDFRASADARDRQRAARGGRQPAMAQHRRSTGIARSSARRPPARRQWRCAPGFPNNDRRGRLRPSERTAFGPDRAADVRFAESSISRACRWRRRSSPHPRPACTISWERSETSSCRPAGSSSSVIRSPMRSRRPTASDS